MNTDPERYQKGFFTRARLSVATGYIRLGRRARWYWLGLIVALPLIALLVLDGLMGSGALVSNGPLSSNHALFGQDCATCHEPFGGVTEARCQSCHEKAGDPLGVYGFQAHYRYRSDSFDRAAASSLESGCFECHREHEGRDALITRVPDDRCGSCHFDRFSAEHPEFQFVAESLPDPANLFFPHTVHVSEVRAEHELEDVERTCLECHVPRPDGRSFEPISFDAHCSSCHLTSGTVTPDLPVRQSANDGAAGVLTLEAIRTSRGPGSAWTFYANPGEFQARGANIRKRPVYHADPWVMENLRLIRERLYPTAELSDLLRASADAGPGGALSLYREAIGTLETRIEELGSEPNSIVQEELSSLEELVAIARARLEDPYSPLDENRFLVSVADANPQLDEEERAAFEQVVEDLTEPCRECHFVESASIRRVQGDQRLLVRAEFNHAAHIVHARCLDCHNQIPIREYAAEDEVAPPEVDHSGVVNLPSLADCQSCHARNKAAEECTTCHAFHPDTERWSNLLRYSN